MQHDDCCAHLQAENKGHGIVIVALEAQVVKERDMRMEAERQCKEVTLLELHKFAVCLCHP